MTWRVRSSKWTSTEETYEAAVVGLCCEQDDLHTCKEFRCRHLKRRCTIDQMIRTRERVLRSRSSRKSFRMPWWGSPGGGFSGSSPGDQTHIVCNAHSKSAGIENNTEQSCTILRSAIWIQLLQFRRWGVDLMISKCQSYNFENVDLTLRKVSIF